jgi:hypothetical protein
VSYYESRIKALEARIEEMAQLERMKAVKVEAQLMITISELQVENARLKAEVERLTKAGDKMIEVTYIKGVAGVDRKGGQS